MALYRNIAGFELQSYAIDPIWQKDSDGVFYDPATEGPYPDPQTVYDVQRDSPVVSIDNLRPLPEQHGVVRNTAVMESGVDKAGVLPLLSIAFVAAVVVAGDGVLGRYRGIGFGAGVGVMYMQLNKRAAGAAV